MSVLLSDILHYTNSVINNSGTYSCDCAVDCFLEICSGIFCSYLENIEVKSDFFQLLFDVCIDYQFIKQFPAACPELPMTKTEREFGPFLDRNVHHLLP